MVAGHAIHLGTETIALEVCCTSVVFALLIIFFICSNSSPCYTPANKVFRGVKESLCPSVCPYFLYVQLLLNGSTSTDETLHSCSIRPEDVHKEK